MVKKIIKKICLPKDSPEASPELKSLKHGLALNISIVKF